jgi:hypothetical protein
LLVEKSLENKYNVEEKNKIAGFNRTVYCRKDVKAGKQTLKSCAYRLADFPAKCI